MSREVASFRDRSEIQSGGKSARFRSVRDDLQEKSNRMLSSTTPSSQTITMEAGSLLVTVWVDTDWAEVPDELVVCGTGVVDSVKVIIVDVDSSDLLAPGSCDVAGL